MPRPLVAALVLAAAAVTATGCTARTAADRDDANLSQANRALDQADNRIKQLEAENAALNRRLAEQGGSSAGTIGADLGDLPEGFTKGERGGAAMSDDFAFAKGSAELNPAARKAIARLAEQIRAGGGRVVIEGHTDDTPVSRPSTKEKYVDNWGLSAARAASVARALAEAGVAADRLFPVGRGSSAPLGGDKARNRRVEIQVLR